MRTELSGVDLARQTLSLPKRQRRRTAPPARRSGKVHLRGIPPIRFRFGPRRRRPARLHADKGYDFDHLRGWLRRRQIGPRIARRGIGASGRLGRHRWVVERAMSWLNGRRRLHRRYECKAEHFLPFVGIASALICFRRLQ